MLQKQRLLSRHEASHMQFSEDDQTWDIEKRKQVVFSDEKQFNLDDLDGFDGFQQHWHCKDIPNNTFTTSYSKTESLLVLGSV